MYAGSHATCIQRQLYVFPTFLLPFCPYYSDPTVTVETEASWPHPLFSVSLSSMVLTADLLRRAADEQKGMCCSYCPG